MLKTFFGRTNTLNWKRYHQTDFADKTTVFGQVELKTRTYDASMASNITLQAVIAEEIRVALLLNTDNVTGVEVHELDDVGGFFRAWFEIEVTNQAIATNTSNLQLTNGTLYQNLKFFINGKKFMKTF